MHKLAGPWPELSKRPVSSDTQCFKSGKLHTHLMLQHLLLNGIIWLHWAFPCHIGWLHLRWGMSSPVGTSSHHSLVITPGQYLVTISICVCDPCLNAIWAWLKIHVINMYWAPTHCLRALPYSSCQGYREKAMVPDLQKHYSSPPTYICILSNHSALLSATGFQVLKLV